MVHKIKPWGTVLSMAEIRWKLRDHPDAHAVALVLSGRLDGRLRYELSV